MVYVSTVNTVMATPMTPGHFTPSAVLSVSVASPCAVVLTLQFEFVVY
jgi:hypothetical protein